MLLQQVMEVSDRLRQNEESSKQVRQLLEAHRTAGKMLEERMNRTEASVRDTSQAGGNSAARALEAPGTDDGRSGFGAFAARKQPKTSMVKTLVGVTGLGCFVLGQDCFNEDECKKSSDLWRHDLEMKRLCPNWIFDLRNGQVLQPTSKASVVGKLAEILRTPSDGDLLDPLPLSRGRSRTTKLRAVRRSAIP